MTTSAQPPGGVEELFDQLQRSLGEFRKDADRAHHQQWSSTTDADRERLRDDRDYRLRVADQQLALLKNQALLGIYAVLRERNRTR